MRVLLSVLLLCLLWERGEGEGGCQVLIELDSNQQWELVRNQFVRLRGGQGYLAAPEERGQGVQLLDSRKGAGKRIRWFFRDGMLWNKHHRHYVLTVTAGKVGISKRGLPPLPDQLFLYANGTLRHQGTGLYLTGWAEAPRVTMDAGGEGCEQTPVVHLLNEQWRLEDSFLRSQWTGDVLTRREGHAELTALPYDEADKSLHQKWYWQNGFLRENKKSVVTILESGEIVAQRPLHTPNQRFSLSAGFVENIHTRHVLYIPKDGIGIQLRERHVYV